MKTSTSAAVAIATAKAFGRSATNRFVIASEATKQSGLPRFARNDDRRKSPRDGEEAA